MESSYFIVTTENGYPHHGHFTTRLEVWEKATELSEHWEPEGIYIGTVSPDQPRLEIFADLERDEFLKDEED